MRFLYKKFQAKRKEIIQVEVDTTTKVKFLNKREFGLYEKSRTHSYFGGTYDAGEIHFVLPYDSVWYAVVETGTYHSPEQVNAKCRLLPADSSVSSSIALDAPDHVVQAIENGSANLALDDGLDSEDLISTVDDVLDEVTEASDGLEDE